VPVNLTETLRQARILHISPESGLYMSDIPLRSFRRNKTPSYIPLVDNDTQQEFRSNGYPDSSRTSDSIQGEMPVTTSITKTSVTSSRRNGKSKGKDRYVDDPEEERLLRGSFEEGSEQSARPPSPVKVRQVV